MSQSWFAQVGRVYRRVAAFFSHEIWQRRLDELSPRRARLYSAARIAYCTLRDLIFGDKLAVHAAALTYFTVLSLVPLLAFAFALLKGFGAYDALVDETIRPYVLGLVGENQALSSAFEKILSFVDSTGITSLGFIGLLTLLYAATRLLRNIEGALNEIWGAGAGRRPLEQLRDYVSMIVITPLCLIGATALTTAGQALQVLQTAGTTLGIGGFVSSVIGLAGPLLVLFAGFLILYKVMPNTSVRFLSAAWGALVGALLWYAVLIAQVRFQIGVARYNALYSSFGAIPIFLAWLQLSWLMVLIGATVAASHQNDRSLAQHRRLAEADTPTRERACLSATLCICRAFVAGKPPPTATELATELDVPQALLETLLGQLVGAGLVCRVDAADKQAFVLARPPSSIRVKDVVDALRLPRHTPERPLNQHDRQSEDLSARLWCELELATESSPANRTLAQAVQEQVSET